MNEITVKLDTSDQISRLLSQNGKKENLAVDITGRLQTIEEKLLKLYAAPAHSNPDKEKEWLSDNGFSTKNFKTVEQAIKAFEFKHQRAVRTMQAFTELMRTMHELLMAGIRNLRLN